MLLKERYLQLQHEYTKSAWEYMVIASVVTILVLYFFNDRRHGTYSRNYLSHSTSTRSKIPYHEKDKKESKPEAITRNVLQKAFRRPFVSIRPNFLYNPVTGHNLEIDCYNDELKLGVEYNGAQHERYIPFFHGQYNKNKFREQRYRDEMKKMMCAKHGINLISIPSTVPYNKIEPYLINKLNAAGYYI